MEKNEKRKKFDSAIFRAYTDLVNSKLEYHPFDGRMKIQIITSIDMYTGEDNLDEKTSFNHEVITSGNLKYGTLEEAKNSLKMFKTFCDDYLIKMEESTGIPFGGSEIHNMMLMVSKEKFVINNVLYPYNEDKYNKILDIINSNDNLLRETMSMQTEEYMSKHISYDNTTKTLFVDNNANYKINCHTGDLSDEEINIKIINLIEKIIIEPLVQESSSTDLTNIKELAKKIFSELDVETDDISITKSDDIIVARSMNNNTKRGGVSAILIGPDNSYLVCGTMKPITLYIEDFKNGERSNLANKTDIIFKKKNESDNIWWVVNTEEFGKMEFSFDKSKIYNLFRDYPHNMKPEEVIMFDAENTYWADFFKNRKETVQESEIKQLEDDVEYERRKSLELMSKMENDKTEHQIMLDKIKSAFFENNEDYFDSVSPYLVETFDYDILSNPTDTCVRFELCDVAKNRKMFFAINKNTFVINDKFKYKLNLRGNTSNDQIMSLLNELKNVASSWNLICTDNGEYYWGLTICNDNKCELYVGKTPTGNWNEFTNIINKYIEELMKGITNEIII